MSTATSCAPADSEHRSQPHARRPPITERRPPIVDRRPPIAERNHEPPRHTMAHDRVDFRPGGNETSRDPRTDMGSTRSPDMYNFSASHDSMNTPSITTSHFTLDEVLHLAAEREEQEIDTPLHRRPDRMRLLDDVNRDAGIMTMLERIKESQLEEQRETRNPNKRRRFSMASNNRNSRISGVGPMVNRITFDGVERTITLSQPRKYIFSTSDISHRVWQLLIAIFAVISGIIVPILACDLLHSSSPFITLRVEGVDRGGGPLLESVESVEVLCDFIFIADIIVNFRTSYEDQVRDVFVTSPQHIAIRYASSWLFIDLLHALPMTHILSLLVDDYLLENHIVFILRMFKTLRLLRLMFPRYPTINRLNSTVHPATLVLIRLVIDLSFVWHIIACIYIYVASVNYNPASMKTETGFYFQTSIPWIPPPHVQNVTEALYIYAVWWAVGVSCSIHRPEPQTYVQLIFTLAITVTGIFLMTLLIGSLTTAIAEIQSINNQTTYKLQVIARYMHNKRLPHDLRARILSYYRFLLLSMNLLDESSVLPGLPSALRMQVSFMVHEPGFVKLSMFWVLKAEEIYFLCQRLKPCILLILDQLVKEGRVGIGLCILEKGQVEVTKRGDFITLLPESTAFGENALEGKASHVTVRASRYCELAILLTCDYHDLISLNTQFAKYLKIYVAERDAKHLNPDMKAMALKAVIASSRTKVVHGWTEPTKDVENMLAWQRAAHRAHVTKKVVTSAKDIVRKPTASRPRRLPSRQATKDKQSGTLINISRALRGRENTKTDRLAGVQAKGVINQSIKQWANTPIKPPPQRQASFASTTGTTQRDRHRCSNVDIPRPSNLPPPTNRTPDASVPSSTQSSTTYVM